MLKQQFLRRIASILLAMTILMTCAIPSSTMGLDDLQNVIDITEGVNGAPDEFEGNPDSSTNIDADEPVDQDDYVTSDAFPVETNIADEPESLEAAEETSELTQEERIKQMEQWANSLQLADSNPLDRSGPGDSGSVSSTTISINPYDVTVPGVGSAYGSIMLRMRINGQDAFCTQIWRVVGSGTYVAGEGSTGNSATAQYIANFMASDRLNTDYVATQVLVWESLYGDIGLYSQIIQGTSHESAYTRIKNGNASGSGLLFWVSGSQDQEIVTPYPVGTPDPGPDPEPDPDPEEEEEGNPPTETVTTTDTRTEVRSDTTYEYSDAIGQVVIAKRDDEGRSLDGAIFDIQIEFSDGQKGGDSSFEVYNGSRLFTYTHPRDNYDPATVKISEIHPPKDYIGDPTPQTAIIHPTYTRVTKVTTTTITITTTTTTTTNIETGEVLSQVTSSSETSLDPPMVQEYTDFVEGDRETSLTFINRPIPCSLTIYKYEKGNYSKALEGARFRIRYADVNVSAQVWELTTASSGEIKIDLPYAGTLVAEELEAPYGYVIGAQSTFTVTVAKGEHKKLDVSNDKKAQIIVYKKDAQTGQFLGGATIKATLLRAHTPPHDQNVSYTATTDSATGMAVFNNVIPGEYRLEEQAPPQFYLPTDVVYNVSVFDGSNEPVTATFENDPWTGLTIRKVDATNGQGLQGAVFKLFEGTATDPSKFLGDFISNENGVVVIQNLESNKYFTIFEAQAPFGYSVDADNDVQTILIRPEAIDKNLTVVFRNNPKPKLLITKIDENTGVRLPGTVFRVARRGSSEYMEVETGSDGTVLLENLTEEWWQILEIRSPSGYILDSSIYDIELVAGETAKLIVSNRKKPTLTINKIDEQSLEGIPGVTFRVTREGAMEYEDVITGHDGRITLKDMSSGWVTLEERSVPESHILDPVPYHIELKPGENSTITITNKRKPSLKIVKLCSVTKQPLQATFEIKVKNDRSLGTFTTDPETGELFVDNLEYYADPLILEISEVVSPDGYLITTDKMEVTIGWGEERVIEWLNTPENPILIYKMDKDGNPIPNTEFLVTTVNGTYVGSYKSGSKGIAVVAGQQPGWYLVTETKVGSSDFILDSTPKMVQLKYAEPAVLEVFNDRLPTLEIIKFNKADNTPLPNVLIRVERMSGELIGDFRTDNEGRITLQTEPGWVVCYELENLPGFVLDQTRIKRELKPNSTETIEIYNVPLPGLQIRKTCSVTGQPLSGVEYTIKRLDGSLIGIYSTDELGIIYLDINESHVVIVETKSLEGYRLDASPRTVQLAPGALTVVSYTNDPYPKFELIKLDKQSKAPLANTKFKLYDQYMREIGIYRTSSLGRIVLTGMTEGKFYVQEQETGSPEYVLDKTVHEVFLYNGKTTTLELFNEKMGTFRLRKVDSENGKPLAGATYIFYDEKDNVLFEKTTNSHGIIEFVEKLEPQKMKCKEIRSPRGYILDSAVYEFEIKSNETTELILKNTPEKGRIQIHKIAAADSPITKIKKGSGLIGARFEVFDERNNLVDIINTDKRGVGTSDLLPLGRYVLKETKSPEFFYSSGEPIYVELKVHDDFVKFTVENNPEDIEVTIEKRGVAETMSGEIFRYDFSNISNNSNCSLDEFYWRDQLPKEIRIESINTGTWSERLKYDVWVKTNLKGWKKIKSGLHTNVEYTIDVRSFSLGLASNEHVTEFKFEFGTVVEGFRCVDSPFIMVRVGDGLPHGHRFVNLTDVGGKRGKEWSYNRDSWVSVIYRANSKLPKTGV